MGVNGDVKETKLFWGEWKPSFNPSRYVFSVVIMPQIWNGIETGSTWAGLWLINIFSSFCFSSCGLLGAALGQLYLQKKLTTKCLIKNVYSGINNVRQSVKRSLFSTDTLKVTDWFYHLWIASQTAPLRYVYDFIIVFISFYFSSCVWCIFFLLLFIPHHTHTGKSSGLRVWLPDRRPWNFCSPHHFVQTKIIQNLLFFHLSFSVICTLFGHCVPSLQKMTNSV